MKYDFLSIRLPADLKDEIRELSIERCEPMTRTAVYLVEQGLEAIRKQQDWERAHERTTGGTNR